MAVRGSGSSILEQNLCTQYPACGLRLRCALVLVVSCCPIERSA
jgi:hypothetical protein